MDPCRGPDSGTLLVRALRASAGESGCAIAVRRIASLPWASATFVGMRHEVTVELPDDHAHRAWLARLSAAEWALRGHLVADVVVDDVATAAAGATASIAILTIEDN